jgi:hippurate hydrolase
MPALNSIAALAPQMTEWRRWLHAHPELGFDLHGTAGYVAQRLREAGVDEIHEGIAETGIVAIVDSGRPGPTVGLRADMDALPIAEETGAAHASTVPGRMHACGHDGHTAMLLGAAQHLAATRNFAGRVALIFQPAEEGGGGAEVMVREGIMERFGIERVWGMHNAPGLPEGHVATGPGPMMAAVDTFDIEVTGSGGHAARPSETRDPIVAALGIGQAIQTIVSRNHLATEDLVVSITQIHAGTTDNVIPSRAMIQGTVRTFEPHVRDMAERRLSEIVAGQAASYGVEAECRYTRGYPPTVNDAEAAAFAARVAEGVAPSVDGAATRKMGAEDFGYMLRERPGAYLFLGAGEGSAGLHHPAFDFNDRIAPLGASLLVRLVEEGAPVG